jgi:alanine dehydrogenase
MSLLELTYLDGPTVRRLALTDQEILDAVAGVLAAHGRGDTVQEPRTHIFPRGAHGHFNVLRGVTPRFAGVKVVGDFVDNHERGLPSELAMLLLMDPMTGVPRAIIDATAVTEMRTGAVTALGARALAREGATVFGHIGTRGTAYWNVRLCASVMPALTEVRVHSLRPASRDAFAARLRRDLRRELTVTVCEDWESTVRGADIVVEASRLSEPAPQLATEWIAPGALVVPYGTMSAVELSLTDVMDKVVVDDWGQAKAGPLGALRAHVDSGRLTEETLHAELGQILAGRAPGRERDTERILFWHRGLSITDIALGEALLDKAAASGIGTLLPYRD